MIKERPKKTAVKERAPAKQSLAVVREKRPPQHPGRKTKSDAELKECYEAVAQAMLNGITKFGEIKRMFTKRDVSPSAAEHLSEVNLAGP